MNPHAAGLFVRGEGVRAPNKYGLENLKKNLETNAVIGRGIQL